jgi:hypothetical protein
MNRREQGVRESASEGRKTETKKEWARGRGGERARKTDTVTRRRGDAAMKKEWARGRGGERARKTEKRKTDTATRRRPPRRVNSDAAMKKESAKR